MVDMTAPATVIEYRRIRNFGLVSLAMLALVLSVRAFIPSALAPRINVRWADQVDAAARAALERRFALVAAEHREGTTWSYDLADHSHDNVRALVSDRAVDDTHYVDRASASITADAPRGSTVTGNALSMWRDSRTLEWLILFSFSSALVAGLWVVTLGRPARQVHETSPKA